MEIVFKFNFYFYFNNVKGNAHFKAGNYLKSATVYTQAMKADPSNATLYNNRSAAFLNLVKLSKGLADAETRKGCVMLALG